jgi:DNA-binding CsgD family transcriptional regulator
VLEATGGNPLLVEELLLDAPDGPDAVAAASVLSVGDRVSRRAARIAAEAPALLRTMSVLGDDARLSAAARVAAVSEEGAGEIAHRLRRLEILVAEDPFRFAQPLMRRSIYHGMPDVERRRLHAAAAELSDMPERAAEHLALLVPDGSSQVAATLVAAAEATQDPNQAIRWLRRALDEGAEEPPRAAILRRLGMTELLVRDSTAIGHLHEALDLTPERSARVAMGVALAEVMAYAGQWDDAMAVMHSIEGLIRDDETALQEQVAAILAVATVHDPARVAIFDRERPRFEELARGDSWDAKALCALLAATRTKRGESPVEALELAERSLEGGTLLAGKGAGGWAAPQLLEALVGADAVDRALEVCDLIEAEARASGSVTGHITAAGYRGWALSRGGDLAGAEREVRRALAQLTDPSMQMITATAYFILTDAVLERPTLADIAAEIETADLDPSIMRTFTGAMLLLPRGLLRVLRTDRTRGIEDIRAVGRIVTALRMGPSVAPWRSALALALPRIQREEAMALAREELELARESGLARPEGVALRAVGLLTPDEPGIDILRTAAEVLEGSPVRLEHARTLVELGAALRRLHRRAEARQPLEAGLEMAVACGAARLAARAREELGATAGRPPRSATNGALTASELRIAQRAAKGASNPDIARELFVTVKTVETHLSHAYAKLGVAGRSELAAALALIQL